MNERVIFELLVHVKSFKFMRQELFLSPSVVGWNDGKYGSGGNRISGSATIHLAQKAREKGKRSKETGKRGDDRNSTCTAFETREARIGKE